MSERLEALGDPRTETPGRAYRRGYLNALDAALRTQREAFEAGYLAGFGDGYRAKYPPPLPHPIDAHS